MKFTINTILLVVVIVLATITAYLVFFKKKGKSLSTSNKANCNSSFLFIGDSLTAYDQSYADQLTQFCPNINIKKIAQVGQKTDWMLQQLITELQNNKYDVISIWGGVNDIYARNQIIDAESNLQQMYDLAKKSGSKVIALTVIPTRTYNISTDQTVNLTKDLNKWILSNNIPDATVDVNSILNDGNDGTKSKYLQSDTLHINTVGQSLIANDFKNKVIS